MTVAVARQSDDVHAVTVTVPWNPAASFLALARSGLTGTTGAPPPPIAAGRYCELGISPLKPREPCGRARNRRRAAAEG